MCFPSCPALEYSGGRNYISSSAIIVIHASTSVHVTEQLLHIDSNYFLSRDIAMWSSARATCYRSTTSKTSFNAQVNRLTAARSFYIGYTQLRLAQLACPLPEVDPPHPHTEVLQQVSVIN
jgi:hypothetical protein